LLAEAAAKDWVSDAFAHCKVMAVVAAAKPLLDAAGVKPDRGVIEVTAKTADAFVEAAAAGRIWEREVAVRGPDKKSARTSVTEGSAKAKSAKLPPAKAAPAKPPKTPPKKPEPPSTPALKKSSPNKKKR